MTIFSDELSDPSNDSVTSSYRGSKGHVESPGKQAYVF